MSGKLPPAILCIGRNYRDHATEMGGDVPQRPVLFCKNPASVIGPEEPIVLPPICREGGAQLDAEGELAVQLGRDARDVAVEHALSFLAGYRIANDVTARWWQKHGAGGQFARGKSFDTFCPLGPLVPVEKLAEPQALDVSVRWSGRLMQQANTSQMIFPVARLIAELSRGMTLLAGTILLTGTPAGVGAARTPPIWLEPGDVVEVEISGLGVLRNPVVAEEAD